MPAHRAGRRGHCRSIPDRPEFPHCPSAKARAVALPVRSALRSFQPHRYVKRRCPAGCQYSQLPPRQKRSGEHGSNLGIGNNGGQGDDEAADHRDDPRLRPHHRDPPRPVTSRSTAKSPPAPDSRLGPKAGAAADGAAGTRRCRSRRLGSSFNQNRVDTCFPGVIRRRPGSAGPPYRQRKYRSRPSPGRRWT